MGSKFGEFMKSGVANIGQTELSAPGVAHDPTPAVPLRKIPFRIRPSLRALSLQLLPFFILFSFLYVLLRPLTAYLSELGLEHADVTLLHLSRFLRAMLLLELARRYYNNIYSFSKRRIAAHYGRLSTNYRVSNIRFTDIREIRVEQSLLGRLFHFGTIQIGTASTDQFEVELRNINLPSELLKVINHQRTIVSRSNSQSSSSND